MAYRAEIPYGAYWSTPFAKWQGSFANLHSLEFAAHVAKAELARRAIDAGDVRLRRARHHGAAEGHVLRPAVVHGADRRRRSAGRPSTRPAPPACAACSPPPRRSRRTCASTALVATCDRDVERSARGLSESRGAGRHGGARELGARQFRLRSARAATRCCRRPRTSPASIRSRPPSSTTWCCAGSSNMRAALADDRAFQKRYMTLPFDVPRPTSRRAPAPSTATKAWSCRRRKGSPGCVRCCPTAP